MTDPNACVEWLAADNIDFDDEPESFIELREGRRVPFLRHVPSDDSTSAPPGPGPSQCVFLSEQGCQVFSERPSACRSYPYDRPPAAHGKVHLTLAPAVQCPSATDVFVTLQADPQLDATAQEYALLVSQRDRELSNHAAWAARHNRLMQLLMRMGKLRLTATETLRRMLDQETIANPPA